MKEDVPEGTCRCSLRCFLAEEQILPGGNFCQEAFLPGFHYESISENAGGGQTGREPLRFIFRRFSGTGNEIPTLKISDKESLVESSDGDVLTSLSGILLTHAGITGPAINET